jgi:hypothetical protein
VQEFSYPYSSVTPTTNFGNALQCAALRNPTINTSNIKMLCYKPENHTRLGYIFPLASLRDKSAFAGALPRSPHLSYSDSRLHNFVLN